MFTKECYIYVFFLAPGLVNSLKASNDLPNAVTLRWQIPSQQNGIIRYYIISYYKEVQYNSFSVICSN